MDMQALEDSIIEAIQEAIAPYGLEITNTNGLEWHEGEEIVISVSMDKAQG